MNRRKLLQSLSIAGTTVFLNSGSTSAETEPNRQSEETVTYKDLSKEAKNAFSSGLSSGVYSDLSRTFPRQLIEHDYVDYKGEVFDLNWTYNNVAFYSIDPKLAESPEAEDTISFTDISSEARHIFKQALENGREEYKNHYPNEFKFEFEHVLYDGEVYDIRMIHQDIPNHIIRPRKTDKTTR